MLSNGLSSVEFTKLTNNLQILPTTCKFCFAYFKGYVLFIERLFEYAYLGK